MYGLTQKTIELLAVSMFYWLIPAVIVFTAAIVGLVLYIRSRKVRLLHLNLTSFQNLYQVDCGLDVSDSFKEFVYKLRKSMGKRGVFLIGSAHPGILPPQVLFKLAASLSEKRKCLIIEGDLKNNSLSKSIGHKRPDTLIQKQLVNTQFENVKLWPAYNFTHFQHMNFAGVIRRAEDNYDYILLYAPDLDGGMACRSIVSSVEKAVIFQQEGLEGQELYKFMGGMQCKIIAEVRVSIN